MGKVTDLTELNAPQNVDVIDVVDVSDITSGAAGTSKKLQLRYIPSAVPGEIKTAYESNADTNAYTSAEKTKLGTVDQIFTAAEKTKVDNIDQIYTQAEKTKLGTVDQIFTQAEKTKLGTVDQIYTQAEKTKLGTVDQIFTAAEKTKVAALGSINDPINNQTDDYTVVLADNGRLVRMNKATAVNVTIPTNTQAAFAIGAEIAFSQAGVGPVTFVPFDETVIINCSFTPLTLTTQHSTAAIKKVDTNTWLLAVAF